MYKRKREGVSPNCSITGADTHQGGPPERSSFVHVETAEPFRVPLLPLAPEDKDVHSRDRNGEPSLQYDTRAGYHLDLPKRVPTHTPIYPEIVMGLTNPVAHWAATSYWPASFAHNRLGRAEPARRRISSSTHTSVYLERMAQNGLHMDSSPALQQSSIGLCDTYLKGNRRPGKNTSFPAENFLMVLTRIDFFDEPRLQRDITPWVVPSAELLFCNGDLKLDYIGEELNANWSRCVPLGGAQPKPTYTAGLQSSAFTKDETNKLQHYETLSNQFLVTPKLAFPFLICEARTGDRGTSEAERHNLYSASIAVKAIVDLYKMAFGKDEPDRVKALYGQVLVFSISHGLDHVYIHGHYAVQSDESSEQLDYRRHEIDLISLVARDGEDMFQAYNFVRNVYDEFAPQHLQRIKDAVALLTTPRECPSVMSHNIWEVPLENAPQADSQHGSQDEENAVYKNALRSATASMSAARTEMDLVYNLNDKMREEYEKMCEEYEKMCEQNRRQTKRYNDFLALIEQQQMAEETGRRREQHLRSLLRTRD